MNAAQLLTFSAAGALLLFAAYTAQRDAADSSSSTDSSTEPDWTDEIDATMAIARNALMPTPASQLEPSAELLDMLKRHEGLRLTRYRLGDGGWTNGYGHYWPDGGVLPPETITQELADRQFATDVEERGARWVRTYVSVDLTQNQFDALVSMAFNLSPKSFRTIADQVNAGNDPEDAALQFVRTGTNLEAGLRLRRAGEISLYRDGVYA